MKSVFLLCGVLGAVCDASECQADENSLLQARRNVRTTKMMMESKDSKATLKSLRDIAHSLLEGSDATMTSDEVNDALDAASNALAELEPAIRQQVENAQQQINDAASAFQVCHGQEQASLRSNLQESMGQRAAAAESCHDTLDDLQTAETQQCNTAEDCLCDEARIRTTDQEALCASVTEIYEVAFCEHHHVCTTFHECHSTAAEVYHRMRADVEAEMELVVQEYIAVEQSRCLTGLIMEAMTPPITPISHAALIACDDVDVTALNINYPEPPAEPAACPAHTHGDPQCGAEEPEPVVTDTPGWDNNYGYTCASYESHRWCANGAFVPGLEWTGQRGATHSNCNHHSNPDCANLYNYPGDNCVVCGKGREPVVTDTPGWDNNYGYTCASYESHRWCANGAFVPGLEWTGQRGATHSNCNHHSNPDCANLYNYPGDNCVVCGKSN